MIHAAIDAPSPHIEMSNFNRALKFVLHPECTSIKKLLVRRLTGVPADCCRYASTMVVGDRWLSLQDDLLALSMQLASSASDLRQSGWASELSSQLVTSPFVDVASCFAFANCLCALQNDLENDQVKVCFTTAVRGSLPGLMLRAAQEVATNPGAVGLWPLVLVHTALYTAKQFHCMDSSSRQALTSVCGTLLACGLQLVHGQPQAATARAIATQGATAAATNAIAAAAALQAVQFLTTSRLEAGRQQIAAALRASAKLVQRSAAQLTKPAASLLLPLPLPEQLLYPQGGDLQAWDALTARLPLTSLLSWNRRHGMQVLVADMVWGFGCILHFHRCVAPVILSSLLDCGELRLTLSCICAAGANECCCAAGTRPGNWN